MMMNDIAQQYRIPWIYGSCVGSYGMSLTILPEQTPCLHCLLETVPVGGPTCDTAGVIQPAARQVVVYQKKEGLKTSTEEYKTKPKELIFFDFWKNKTLALTHSRFKN